MGRKIAWIAVELTLSLAFALMILTAWLGLHGGSVTDAFLLACHHLFLFMDVGLVVFLLWLVLRAARNARPYAAIGAAVGALLNLLAVLLIGLAQEGAVPTDFLLTAVTAGIAFVLAVMVATPIAHGLTRERD